MWETPIKFIYYCKYYQPAMDTLAIELPLASNFFSLLTRLILIILYYIQCICMCMYVYVYKAYVCKMAVFFKISDS